MHITFSVKQTTMKSRLVIWNILQDQLKMLFHHKPGFDTLYTVTYELHSNPKNWTAENVRATLQLNGIDINSLIVD